MFLIVLVIDDPSACVDLLRALDDAGVPGGTILDSTGMRTAQQTGPRDDIPLLPSLEDLFRKKLETRNRTIFSVVPDRETVHKVAEVAQDIIGSFDDENTGFMFSIKVDEAFGLRKNNDS